MKITSATFFDAWITAVQEMRPQLMANWRDSTRFTTLIKSSEDCVLRRVAARLALECYPQDYYFIDAVFYEPGDAISGIPIGSTWLSGLSVAFEHENDYRSPLYTEVSHLLIANADLRVLVTYPYDGIEDSEFGPVYSLIRESRHSKEISEKENFLLIFGYPTPFEWEGFVFKEEKWKRLDLPNHAPEPTRTAVTPPAGAGDRASGARGSP